ncbi:MAG: choice-of-anchor M domain-containing protein [Curtobacterium sp.]
MTNTITHSARRRVGLAGSAVAILAALAVGLGSTPANAADLSSGHVDFVSVAANGSQLKLGSNVNDTGWVAASTNTLKVASTSGASGTGYILPESHDEADARGVPFAGFSGDEDLRDLGFVAGNTVTVKLESVAYTPASGQSGTGTVSISQGGTAWFTNAAKTHAFTVESGSDEAYHQHAKWVFSKAGTYKLTFSASGKGKSAGSTTYTVKAGV